MSKRSPKKQKAPKRPIAYLGGMTAVEGLPLQHVHYPGFYGTFFAFSESLDSPLRLCACSLAAIENYMDMRASSSVVEYGTPTRNYLIDSLHFPTRLVVEFMGRGISTRSEVLRQLRYERGLCHECNRATPTYRYCHEMYGTVFIQNYGWYVNKQRFEYALYGNVGDSCPQEIRDLIEIDPIAYEKEYERLLQQDGEAAREMYKQFTLQKRNIDKLIENEVRRKFGHKKVGEAWTSETILYYQVVKLMEGHEVLHHYRPDFLDGLELDIYVPHLKQGIEYQGIQHYEAVEHWGGQEALERTRQRDEKKRELCRAAGVKLIYFDYDEDLDVNEISRRILAAQG